MAGSETTPIPRAARERALAAATAPVAQVLLDNPSQTDKQIQDLLEKDPSYLTAISPLYAVLAHLITMPMLSDMTYIPTSRPFLPDKGVLSTISPEVLTFRMHPDPELGYIAEEDVAFGRLQMESFNPYFNSVVTQLQDTGNPYHRVWKKFEEIAPLYFSEKEKKEPVLGEHHRCHGVEDPVSGTINGLHIFFWEGLSAPIHAKLATSFMDLDTISSVGQFQRQAIERGIVGLLAQQSEMSRNARNKKFPERPYLPLRAYTQDSATGIISWGEDLAKSIKNGVTKCPVPDGLLSPDRRVREMCQAYNTKNDDINRSGILFCPVGVNRENREQIVSASEVLARFALLNAPSTLWRPFLQANGITDWSDALPGTRLPLSQKKTAKVIAQF